MKKFNFNHDRYIFFDGAMGTQLQMEVKENILPEEVNIKYPDILEMIHKRYVDAGADVITTNTFGANEFKLEKVGLAPEEVIKAGTNCARKAAGERAVALDVGPLGKMFVPMGDLTFDLAYKAFARQMIAGEKAGCDLIIIETMTDLYEMKCAVLAAKENTSLPVICTMTFEENGKTFMGADSKSMVALLEGMGVDALGVNCSLGPDKLIGTVEEILKHSSIPVIVQPNAGIPVYRDDETTYDITKEQFADAMVKMADMGVLILGGCCGTTPEYISNLIKALEGKKPVKPAPKDIAVTCSSRKCVYLDDGVVSISENMIPHGNEKVTKILKSGNYRKLVSIAREIKNKGADILNINTSLEGVDEKAAMVDVVNAIQQTLDIPLQIETKDVGVLEAALRTYSGKAVINSVNGTEKSMKEVFPLMKKYGGVAIALLIDEDGLGKTGEKRLEIAAKILSEAKKYGLGKKDFVFDCLSLPAATNQESLIEALKAIRLIKENLGGKTLMGIGNVSYKLPKRGLLNRTYLAMSLGAGLDAFIMDFNDQGMKETLNAAKVILNIDKSAEKYIETYAKKDENS
ncbi:homocysteine S-methyltransferase family protein [Alkalibacter saccharofermentans]|uniref:Methionine synthase n=1 Tax=Alkalibacter saccharofermentans DSM 14828 TaxID=1120975 RepID=A0A1M4VDD4_9FIRM|nr:homocysteine S-methyltransferase family protein [Alkalibacter saccharofermentans]SHE66840.1 5-methyltetrahydrofolate--homocysteine methyltransferase [Alkalibacter saccharofermentans DSM 14828]